MRRLMLCALVLALSLSQAQALTLATYPSNDPATLRAAFTPLADYLADTLDTEVRLVVTANYAELSQRLRDGSTDIAWIGSSGYVQTKRDLPGLRYLATYQEFNATRTKRTPYYKAVILSLKGTGIHALADLAGKRFGFTDKGSTSGYAYPMMMLHDNGIKPQEYFSKVFFLKKHDKVLQALVHGSIDAGAVSDGTLERGIATFGDMFHVLLESAPIPLDAIVAAPHVVPAHFKAIQRALEDIPADHPANAAIRDALGWRAAGFRNMGDGFYDSLRTALQYKK